jgi:hypothetical protein
LTKVMAMHSLRCFTIAEYGFTKEDVTEEDSLEKLELLARYNTTTIVVVATRVAATRSYYLLVASLASLASYALE